MADLVLGATIDPATQKRSEISAVVATDDLVTHGVIVGMTGSGKTGLGVVLVEECLSAGVPALLFDPKGDLTNLALVLPGLTGPEFAPWVDPSAARKQGLSVEQFAEQQATTWREGLADWGIAPERLAALRESVDIAVYTPGSTAGLPLNILGSLTAPPAGTDAEIMADEIQGYSSSLLGLLDIDADPLTSREHILLSTIIHEAWSRGESLDLAALITRVQQPPFRKLGVFELDQFYPPADRMTLALQLNGVLASPGFASWIAGDPVDVGALLTTPDGRPRCSILTVAHLSDSERQAVTSLVLSKVVTWMRRQSGTTDLRALLYLDEVAGYLPPVGNPPTKQPLMLLMKQARAFGLGVVLATQNPVDVDYKALSNAGTWLIGRLQTEQDKGRLLDGLTSAAGEVDAAAVGATISGLGKRQFLLRQAGSDQPTVMTTRWAMSYLRGPLTREQIAGLTAVRSADSPTPARDATPGADTAPATAAGADVGAADDETPVAPLPPTSVPVSYLDPAAAWAGALQARPGTRLQAAAVGRVRLRYDEASADLVHDEEYEAVLFPLPQVPDAAGLTPVDYDDRDLLPTPPDGARYVVPAGDLSTTRYWTDLKRAVADHLVRTRPLEIVTNPSLTLASRPGETQEDFAQRCRVAADEAADKATAALQAKAEAKLRALHTRLNSAVTAAGAAEADRNAQIGTEVAGQVGSMLGGLFGGRRSRASVATAARRAQTAQRKVDTARAKADDLAAQVADLEAEIAAEVAALDAEWAAKATTLETRAVPLEKTDVTLVDLRLLWVPVG
jgi:hypothetical protein